MKTLSRWLAALALASLAPSARAESDGVQRITGRVVHLYGADIVVDVTPAQGAKPGGVLELWRPLELKHPVTGEKISDQFLIGQLRLTQVRDALSFARPI